MADTPITERQKFWRDHVLAAATFDGTIVEYAEANNLKTKDIYQGKTSLAKRGPEIYVNSDWVCLTAG